MRPPMWGNSVDCQGYGLVLTPWACLENQLSLFCLPGFPCHDCEAGVTIQIPPSPPLEKGGEIRGEVGQPGGDPGVTVSSFSHPGGALSLKKAKSRKVEATAGRDARPTWDKKTMTRAVARDLGLI